jgi:hypothetical protein
VVNKALTKVSDSLINRNRMSQRRRRLAISPQVGETVSRQYNQSELAKGDSRSYITYVNVRDPEPGPLAMLLLQP